MYYFSITTLILVLLVYFKYLPAETHPIHESNHWEINTSNSGKLEEFKKFFFKYNLDLTSTRFDLDEIDADPITVAAHKASQMGERILIEDTSLDIEGADVGINVRWLIDNLDRYVGKKASWKVLLAYRTGDKVVIYEGSVTGTIVHARGDKGFGFDPFFLPDNATQTLAESKPDEVNARALAVKNLAENKPLVIVDAIYQWDGPWQEN